MQSRKASLCEALVNNAVGFFLSVAATWVVLEWLPLSHGAQATLITWVCTVLSIARSYTVRRWFNGMPGPQAGATSADRTAVGTSTANRGAVAACALLVVALWSAVIYIVLYHGWK